MSSVENFQLSGRKLQLRHLNRRRGWFQA